MLDLKSVNKPKNISNYKFSIFNQLSMVTLYMVWENLIFLRYQVFLIVFQFGSMQNGTTNHKKTRDHKDDVKTNTGNAYMQHLYKMRIHYYTSIHTMFKYMMKVRMLFLKPRAAIR